MASDAAPGAPRAAADDDAENASKKKLIISIMFINGMIGSFTTMLAADATNTNFVFELFEGKAVEIGFIGTVTSVVSLVMSGVSGYLYDLNKESMRPLINACLALRLGLGVVGLRAIMNAQPGVNALETFYVMLTVGAISAMVGPFIGTYIGSSFSNALDTGHRAAFYTYFNQAMVLVMVLGRLVTGGWAVRHTFPDGNPLHADADGDAFPRNMDYGLARWSFEDLRWMILIGSAISMAFAPIVLLMPSVPPPISKKTMSEETEASTSIWETCRAEGHLLLRLYAADLSFTVVGGVLITFWPVYMIQSLRMDPLALQGAFIVGMLFTVYVQGALLDYAESGGGRLRPILYTESIATAALFCIGISTVLFEPGTWQASLSFFVFFQVRIIFRGVSGPLYGSLEQDLVPASQRGRWGALGSIHDIAGSVAAVTGGYLIDTVGFVPTFMGVGIFQAISIVLFLLPIKDRIDGMEAKLIKEKATLW